MGGVSGSQSICGIVFRYWPGVSRTNVSEECQQSMIELHGQEAWDKAIAQQEAIDVKGVAESEKRSDEEIAALVAEKIASAPPIGTGILVLFVLSGIFFSFAKGVAPNLDQKLLLIGALGTVLLLVADILLMFDALLNDLGTFSRTCDFNSLPSKTAVSRLVDNELLRVVFPPLVLIVAVLGQSLAVSLTPPQRLLLVLLEQSCWQRIKLKETDRSGKFIITATFALIIMLLIGINFDLRINTEQVSLESWVAFFVAYGAIHGNNWINLFGLYAAGVMTSVVQGLVKLRQWFLPS